MTEPCKESRNQLAAIVNSLGEKFKLTMEERAEGLSGTIDEINDDLPDTEGADAAIGIEFDVDWKIQTIKLHLPETTMKLQSWHFHLPSVTMKDKRIVFHTPSVRMVPKKIGQYPEFHGFKVVWKDIITHVPETFMEKHEIVMGIPEVRMEEQHIKLHVPEFTMKLQEIKLHLPEFRVRDIEVEAGRATARAEEAADHFRGLIAGDRESFLSSAREEVTPAVSSLFTCMRTHIQNKKEETVALFEPAVGNLRTSLEKLRNVGASDQIPPLESQLNDLLAKKQDAARRFEESIANMLAEERATLDRILSAFS